MLQEYEARLENHVKYSCSSTAALKSNFLIKAKFGHKIIEQIFNQYLDRPRVNRDLSDFDVRIFAYGR